MGEPRYTKRTTVPTEEAPKDFPRPNFKSVLGKLLAERLDLGWLNFWAKNVMGIEADAFVVLTNEKTGEVTVIPGRNLVTNAGDQWYAESACAETPTNDFVNLYLATACSEGGGDPTKTSNYSHFTLHAGSEKAPTGGYPKSDDDDGDNTGAGVDIVSWAYAYGTGDGPFVAVTHSFISVVTASGSDPILNGYKWGAAWGKDASTSAKVFANHEMLGS